MTMSMSSGARPRRSRLPIRRLSPTRFIYCRSLADSLSPWPVSTKILLPSDSINRQFRLIGTRLSSSGWMTFSQRTLGTRPKGPPPSDQVTPSLTICRFTLPRCTLIPLPQRFQVGQFRLLFWREASHLFQLSHQLLYLHQQPTDQPLSRAACCTWLRVMHSSLPPQQLSPLLAQAQYFINGGVVFSIG